MNKVLVTARKVKGITEEELAAVLGLTATAYKQLEMQLLRVTPELAQALAAYFSLPPFYFTANKPSNIQQRITYLQSQIATFSEPQFHNVPPNAPLSLVTTVLELLITKDKLLESMSAELEIMEDFKEMIVLCENLINQLNKNPKPTKK